MGLILNEAKKAVYIDKFKERHKRKTGIEFSDAEALAHFEKLICLVKAVYKPIPIRDLNEDYCSTCQQQIKFEDFKNHLSINECLISGLCQKCQEETLTTI
jgi:hypothetical protein